MKIRNQEHLFLLSSVTFKSFTIGSDGIQSSPIYRINQKATSTMLTLSVTVKEIYCFLL
jgi:hypothetical protein